ncbi:hypothetical protein P261_02127 [Lachnospiraceae bacterium TWA4]|nr:hypothetical protein P261_02127 [Lachnospiraceae bacterium TWA4]
MEAHVLRYWEEELGIDIPRNEMGHREYLEEHIQMFKKILDMKEDGYQLRAIRAALKKDLDNIQTIQAIEKDKALEPVPEEPIQKFQLVMNQILSQALEENNDKLGKLVDNKVSQLINLQEEREKERFRKLDELLRAYQIGNKARYEAAATRNSVIPLRRNKKNDYFLKEAFNENSNKNSNEKWEMDKSISHFKYRSIVIIHQL